MTPQELKKKLLSRWRTRALVTASITTLLALALMCWSVVDPRPFPVIAAMTVAQGLGTLSLLLYAVVVLADVRKARILDETKDPSR